MTELYNKVYCVAYNLSFRHDSHFAALKHKCQLMCYCMPGIILLY